MQKTKFKKKPDLGTCQFCGETIHETRSGWGCLNSSCRAIIYRDDRFFEKVLNKKITRDNACKLLMGDTLRLYGVEIKGEKCDINLSWGLTNDPRFKYGYHMEFLNNKKNTETGKNLTGFDIINEE